MIKHYKGYIERLNIALQTDVVDAIEELCLSLLNAWQEKKQIFICGNGGSAGNAIHLANDFNYGIDKKNGIGM